jgi:hypothetical protein
MGTTYYRDPGLKSEPPLRPPSPPFVITCPTAQQAFEEAARRTLAWQRAEAVRVPGGVQVSFHSF